MGCGRKEERGILCSPRPCIKRGPLAGLPQFAALGTSPSSSSLCSPSSNPQLFASLFGKRAGHMASNYVDTAPEEGRFHAHAHGYHHHGTTPTGAAAASPKHMRRSWSSASSAQGHGHGAAPKCVCAPATHAGSFKCRLHRSSTHGHGHPASPPFPAAAATTSAAPPPSSRTVAAQ